MSHYICGMDKKTYKIYRKTEDDFKALAELKYSMSNQYAPLPYAALMAMEYYHGVSGSGDVVEYSKKDIEQAIEELDIVRKFLTELLKHNERKYLIGWW